MQRFNEEQIMYILLAKETNISFVNASLINMTYEPSLTSRKRISSVDQNMAEIFNFFFRKVTFGSPWI
jgi:hypothetical protein